MGIEGSSTSFPKKKVFFVSKKTWAIMHIPIGASAFFNIFHNRFTSDKRLAHFSSSVLLQANHATVM